MSKRNKEIRTNYLVKKRQVRKIHIFLVYENESKGHSGIKMLLFDNMAVNMNRNNLT